MSKDDSFSSLSGILSQALDHPEGGPKDTFRDAYLSEGRHAAKAILATRAYLDLCCTSAVRCTGDAAGAGVTRPDVDSLEPRSGSPRAALPPVVSDRAACVAS